MRIRILNSATQTEVQRVDLDTLLAEDGSCFVGRSQNSGLVLDSPNVSRLHGKLARREGQVFFSDLGSTNGSMLQDHIAAVNQDYELHSGDIVYIGGFTLVFEDAALDAPGAEISGIEESTEAAVAGGALEVVEPELITESPGAIVPYHAGGLSLEVKTRALWNVIRRRAIADLRVTGKFTREAFLKAAQTAKESIEEHIDQEQLEHEMEKYWQSMTKTSADVGARLGESAAKGASELGSRLGAAAKAAWKEFVSGHPQESTSVAEAVLEQVPPEEAAAAEALEETPAVEPPVEAAASAPADASTETGAQDSF